MNLLVALFRQADDVLRRGSNPAAVPQRRRASSLGNSSFLIVAFGIFYGGMMGTYGGFTGARIWQVVYSGVKVPLLLTASFVLSLPSFFVSEHLARVTRRLRSCHCVSSDHAGGSDRDPGLIGTADGVLVCLGLRVSTSNPLQWPDVRRGQHGRPGAAPPRVSSLDRTSPGPPLDAADVDLIYVFVGIQMGWVLRPFIGDPRAPVQFFREDSWSNAYVVVLEMVWRVVTRTI